MNALYHTAVWVHVMAAMIWLGGMLVFALLAPILRRTEEGVRQKLFHDLGTRFRLVGWICIGLLLITGTVQLRARGWWGADLWTSALFWGSATGRALAAKLLLVTLMLVMQALHDFWLGPRAGQVPAGSDEARTLRRTASYLARFSAVAGIVLVWFAVALARGL